MDASSFIDTAGLESKYNIKLPCFYNDNSIEILTKIKSSLDAIYSPTSKKNEGLFIKITKAIAAIPSVKIDNSTNINASPLSYVSVDNSHRVDNSVRNVTVLANNRKLTQQEIKAEEKRKKEEEDKQTFYYAAVISAVAMVIGSYCIGSSFAEIAGYDEDIEKLDLLKTVVSDAKRQKRESGLYNYTLAGEQSQILNKQIENIDFISQTKIFSQLKTSAWISVGLTSSMVGSAIFGLIGALAKSKPMIWIAGTVVLVTVCGKAAVWGYQWFSKRRFQDKVAEVQNKINPILNVLKSIPRTSIEEIAQYMPTLPQQPFYYGNPNFAYYVPVYQQPQQPQQQQQHSPYPMDESYNIPVFHQNH